MKTGGYLIGMAKNHKELMTRIVIDEMVKDGSFMGLNMRPMETYIRIAEALGESINTSNMLRYKKVLWNRHGIRKIKNQGCYYLRVDITKRPVELRNAKKKAVKHEQAA